MKLAPDTLLTITIPAGMYPLLRAGLDHVPAPRVVTDQAIALCEAAFKEAALNAAQQPRAVKEATP